MGYVVDSQEPPQEPDWEDLKRRMGALTLKELKPVRSWFVGSLGGASGKSETIDTMVGQMCYWWRHCEGGHGRVKNVIEELETVEFLRQEGK